MVDELKRRESFLAELTELSKKYELHLWSCGHCDSIQLRNLPEGVCNGGYVADGQYTYDLRWSKLYEVDNDAG